jgi:protoheme IX farnesyltransferase
MSTALSSKSIANQRTCYWKESAAPLLSLVKIRTSLLVPLTTVTGYFLATKGISIQMLVPATAVFLLACGSCALNQYQEKEIDSLMERTKNRPLPSGRLSPSSALFVSLGLISVGSVILFHGTSMMVGILGLVAIFLYNGIYTYLKRITAFAAIPGALIGAIPPALGWVSGAGGLLDPRIWAVMLFFFMWQVSHFWLLMSDYGKDYEKARLPSLTRIFTAAQLRRILFVWIFATAVASLILPLFGLVTSGAVRVGFLVTGFWLVWKAFTLLKSHHAEFSLRPAFNSINAYVLLIVFLLTLDHLL